MCHGDTLYSIELILICEVITMDENKNAAIEAMKFLQNELKDKVSNSRLNNEDVINNLIKEIRYNEKSFD